VTEGHSAAGRSIIEMLWEQADILYAKLMELPDNEKHSVDNIAEYIDGVELEETAEDVAQSVADYWELRGKLGGLSYALSKMLYTYEPTKAAMDKIRAELKERWESEEEEE
jgi:hypothetical protein